MTLALIGALEGAFVLARTLRSTEPLLAAGRTLAPQYRGVALPSKPHAGRRREMACGWGLRPSSRYVERTATWAGLIVRVSR